MILFLFNYIYRLNILFYKQEKIISKNVLTMNVNTFTVWITVLYK